MLTGLAGVAGASDGHFVSPKGFHLDGSPHNILGELVLGLVCLVYLVLAAPDATRPTTASTRESDSGKILLLLIGTPLVALAAGILLGRPLCRGFDAATFAVLASLGLAALGCLLAISPDARKPMRQAALSARRAWPAMRHAWRARLMVRWARPDPMAWWHSLPEAARVALLALAIAVPAGVAVVAAFSNRRP